MEKIIIVTDDWESNKYSSGVITALKQTKKNLEKKGFKVFMLHPKLFLNVPLPSYAEIRLAIFPKRKLKKMFEKIQADYIHIATEGSLGYAAREICLEKDLKFTTSHHTRLPEYIEIRTKPFGKLTKKAASKYLKWFHSKSEKIMVSTESLKKELEKQKFKNVVAFPFGVDIDFFTKNPKAIMPKALKAPVFVFMGRVAPEKNIEAFLNCELPGSKLIIGNGPHLEKLKKEYEKTAIFVGHKKGKRLNDLLSISDVFVFPSKTDTFGLVLIEALACGLPVAAFNVQGPKDIVKNDINGYLGPNLEKNAKKCLTINRENCRKSILKYSWDSYADEFIKTLVAT